MTPHRIRRQRWELRAATPADAFEVRRQLREAWEPELLPVFERAFDAAAGGATVHIPRIELRLAVASHAELAELLPGLIEAALAEQLRDLARPVVPGTDDSAAAAGPFATLVHYLRTGALPWWGAGASLAEAAGVLRGWARRERTRVLALAAEDESFCFRLLQLLDDADDVLPPSAPAEWRDAVARLLAPAGAQPPSRYTRLRVAAALVSRALSGSAPGALPDPAPLAGVAADAGERAAVRALLASVPAAPPAWSPMRAGEAVRASRAPHPPDPAAPRTPAERPAAPDAPADAQARTADDPVRGHAPAPSAAPAVRADAAQEPTTAPRRPDTEPESLPVAHAGLILLHPFIAPLFTHTGVARDGAIAPEMLPRAAALLHYLAAGEREPFELELGTIKVLLGLTPDAPLPVAAGLLRPGDAEEAEALLESVVSHWKALRGTSVEGLRGSFIARAGLLQRADEGWRLRVEPSGFDVLLHHLPWSFAVARLPWMPKPVHTEWTTH